MKLEINMRHLQGNAIPAGPLSDSDEIFVLLWYSYVGSVIKAKFQHHNLNSSSVSVNGDLQLLWG